MPRINQTINFKEQLMQARKIYICKEGILTKSKSIWRVFDHFIFS